MMPGNLERDPAAPRGRRPRVDALERRGQLVLVEAEPLVGSFMRDGEPDRGALPTAIGELVGKARLGGGALNNVRVVGEMVDGAAAPGQRAGGRSDSRSCGARWSGSEAISVLCGYHIEPAERTSVPTSVAGSHSHVIEDLSSRDRLLHAGRELFTAVGFQEASTASIARQAGTSESQLVKHFTNKNGLLEAIFEDWWDRRPGRDRTVEASPLQPIVKLVQHLRSAARRARLRRAASPACSCSRATGCAARSRTRCSRSASAASRAASTTCSRSVGNGRLVALGVSIPAVRAALVGACLGLVRDRLACRSERGRRLRARTPSERRCTRWRRRCSQIDQSTISDESTDCGAARQRSARAA